jgi:hypothetical protein
VDGVPREKHTRERVLFSARWDDGRVEIRRTLEPLHEDFGVVDVGFIEYRSLNLAQDTRYRLRAEVWRDKGGVAQMGVHDKFSDKYLVLVSAKGEEDRWSPLEAEFATGAQGWLRVYFYNRSKGGQKVRFRNVGVLPATSLASRRSADSVPSANTDHRTPNTSASFLR